MFVFLCMLSLQQPVNVFTTSDKEKGVKDACDKLQVLGHKLLDNGGAKWPCHPIVELVMCLSVLCSVMASLEEVAAVGQVLVDPAFDLTRRFRALFTLKNLGGKVITDPLKTLIHHTASVLLQSYCLIHILKGTIKKKKMVSTINMVDTAAIPSLLTVLKRCMWPHSSYRSFGQQSDVTLWPLLHTVSVASAGPPKAGASRNQIEGSPAECGGHQGCFVWFNLL